MKMIRQFVYNYIAEWRWALDTLSSDSNPHSFHMITDNSLMCINIISSNRIVIFLRMMNIDFFYFNLSKYLIILLGARVDLGFLEIEACKKFGILFYKNVQNSEDIF